MVSNDYCPGLFCDEYNGQWHPLPLIEMIQFFFLIGVAGFASDTAEKVLLECRFRHFTRLAY
jgi:hypothetical protein